MNNVVHAHKLMDFMQANPQLSSVDEIKTEFIKQFGDVRFTNCTNNIYTIDEIFLFLYERNKVQNFSDGIKVNENNRCDDD